MNKFMSCFKFDSSKGLFVGVEREYFITDSDGNIVPKAELILNKSFHDNRFGYELSACQIESRSNPVIIDNINKELLEVQKALSGYTLEAGHGRLKLSCDEVAPETIPLDVYPDPSGRYQEIVKTMPKEILLAACRVIGTHIHIGMPSHKTALTVYNEVIKNTDKLCKMGDKSNGKRLEIYKKVAPDCLPLSYANWSEFQAKAIEKGFDSDPRRCWTLIRISKHGTIEFRMFGTTDDIDEITEWTKHCYSLCKEALLL